MSRRWRRFLSSTKKYPSAKNAERVRHPLKRVARLLSNNQHIHDKPVYLKLFQIFPSYTFNKLYSIQTFSTTRYIFFFLSASQFVFLHFIQFHNSKFHNFTFT